MAKKRIQACRIEDGTTTDHNDVETESDDERGRTVCALVGDAIHKGIKIPLQWNEDGIPQGEHRTTFSSYIGVVVRERVSIAFETWKDVPNDLLDEVYNMITVHTCHDLYMMITCTTTK